MERPSFLCVAGACVRNRPELAVPPTRAVKGRRLRLSSPGNGRTQGVTGYRQESIFNNRCRFWLVCDNNFFHSLASYSSQIIKDRGAHWVFSSRNN